MKGAFQKTKEGLKMKEWEYETYDDDDDEGDSGSDDEDYNW